MKTLINFIQANFQNSNFFFQTEGTVKTYDFDEYRAKIALYEELRLMSIPVCKANKSLLIHGIKALHAERDELVNLIIEGATDELKAEQKIKIQDATELLYSIGQIVDEITVIPIEERGKPLHTMVMFLNSNDKLEIEIDEENEIIYKKRKKSFRMKDSSKYYELQTFIAKYLDLRDERIKAEKKAARKEAREEAKRESKAQRKSDTFTEKVEEKKIR